MDNNLKIQQKSKIILIRDLEKIRDFQRKIYQKAKLEKDFRFYILYDKIVSVRFLHEAYLRVRENYGSAGVDGVTFEFIDHKGVDNFIYELSKELKEKQYKPSPVKRVYIPKANGKKRPLGIPTIKDRVVQMSCKMIIEPIFESDFEKCSYGFRPKKRAAGAIEEIKIHLKNGKTEVLDADLSAYFDTIPHDKLMKTVGKRISDKYVLNLIKMWLKAPISENGILKKSTIGTPQGGVISPLLANIYLDILDKVIKDKWKLFKDTGIKIVRYADDFVLMGEEIKEEHLNKLLKLLGNMGLKLNEEKTKIVKSEKESFDFLGFTFRYDVSLYNGTDMYWNVIPSKNSQKKLRKKIKDYLRYGRQFPAEIISKDMNDMIRGWINYYTIKGVSYPSKAKRDLRWYLNNSFQRFYRRKSQRVSGLYRKGAYKILVSKYGLIEPTNYWY